MQRSKMAMIALGSASIAIGILNLISTLNFISHSRSVPGVITEMDVDSTPDGSSSRPVVAFVTREGRAVSFTGKDSFFTFHRYQPGEAVSVLYNPDQPEEAQIDSFFYRWKEFVFFVLLGLVLIACGKGKFESAGRKP